MAAVIRAYQECCAEVIGRWGGHVAKYMGDGVLAYFGWPVAHEDQSERAVRAGLELTTAVARVSAGEGTLLAARVGIATGLVMVGELVGAGAAQEQTVVGETPNLAARLQALAAPGSVVISQATRRLVGGLFELADLGSLRLKGFAEPLAAWRVEGEGRPEGRFEALHGEHLTPLVGREHELGILMERWAWAKDGDGQVVLLAGLAARQPVLALYEDVHWIDPSTLELLGLVIERVPQLRVLVLITFRPEFQPPWTSQAHVTTLTMSRLGRRQGADLVARVTGEKPLPAEIVEQIVAKTDGVPLFVEELTKTVLESGLLADVGDRYELTGPLPPLAIPTTLHDSLMARLDRLAPVKEVAQIGAVIGREFSHGLVAALAPMSANLLADALEQLVSSELVFRRGHPPDATYTFKHALVQDGRINRCSSRSVSSCTGASPRYSRSSFRMSAIPSRKCWPSI